jgi:hypothetical protein
MYWPGVRSDGHETIPGETLDKTRRHHAKLNMQICKISRPFFKGIGTFF